MSELSFGPFELADEEATIKLGQRLAPLAKAGRCIFLVGPLGAGKTTLVRSLLRSLGHIGAVRSPTYNLMENYQLGELSLLHLDLYRLGDPEEVEYLGLREMLDDSCLLVEWPDRGIGFLPAADVVIHLGYRKAGRTAHLEIKNGLSIDLEAEFKNIS
ncbi:MAG: tRNA (adenosine(37)-N6)-threonylcarbamoyltransferase complex ATPase subunit type 1 TsaE [Lysobacteraceae bacterium]|nr:MAG: tRNA (adenosine(37)-N6)-threonylcarbamoyltransferase complex ATPase subunit type 1 TsaE [Xanthomonadaceae bacterium]